MAFNLGARFKSNQKVIGCSFLLCFITIIPVATSCQAGHYCGSWSSRVSMINNSFSSLVISSTSHFLLAPIQNCESQQEEMKYQLDFSMCYDWSGLSLDHETIPHMLALFFETWSLCSSSYTCLRKSYLLILVPGYGGIKTSAGSRSRIGK